jgi:glyoxylase-like metal-dependent hydrolase (beta-lactamase superfamily II)
MTLLFRTVGSMSGPEFFLRRGGGGLRGVRMPATVAVLERPDGLVLIDCGWSRTTCAWPHRDPGRAKSFFMGLDVKPEDAIASQLLSLEYAPGDVKHVIATHLHVDHVGGLVDFPKATLHCTQTEWDGAMKSKRTGFDKRTFLHPDVKKHTLHTESALGFSRSHDLFGDGTVLLLDACGHTAGSMAVAVKHTQGWCVHAGDATMFVEDFHDDAQKPPSLYMRAQTWDLSQQRMTYGALLRAEVEGGARIVPSHDMAVFDSLPHTRSDAWVGAWVKPRVKQQSKKKA